MKSFKLIFSIMLVLLLQSGIQSFSDTFVVTNLNDSGEGSLRRAIMITNAVEGPDEIVFEEGLTGTIFQNLGTIFIQDDLTITGPGADKITIDADGNSDVFAVQDFDDEINRVVKISGLRFINGNAFEDGALVNYEILTVDRCEFMNCNATLGGGAIGNRKILAVNSCLFENNSAPEGGAISNYDEAHSLSILNSKFINNQADSGGAIYNNGTIEVITNSTFTDNTANLSEFSAGGAIQNNLGTIKEVSHSTFHGNVSNTFGGAIENLGGFIETIVNSTFNENIAASGGAISNSGVMNISFTTISGNESSSAGAGGGILLVPFGIYQIRNSIIAFNAPSNCAGPIGDIGGNYSNDVPTDSSRCYFLGDGSKIILGPLADNGGATETMALLAGNPIDGATVNCDALEARASDGLGIPIGIPIGVDQRYFPRPLGVVCDSGAFEDSPSATVRVAKITDPSGGRDFRFASDGFNPLQNCPLDGGGDGFFALNDRDSITCNVPQGNYSIRENIPQGYELAIICLEAPDKTVINDETGQINFTIESSKSEVDCIFTNVRIHAGGGGGCTLAQAGATNSIPLYLLMPVLIMIRSLIKSRRS